MKLTKRFAPSGPIEFRNNTRRAKIIHYYARFGWHKSGVTESITVWLNIAPRTVPKELWSARGSRNQEHRDLKALRQTGIKLLWIPHISSIRALLIPVFPFWKIHKGDIFFVHEGWVLSNVIAVFFSKLRGAYCVSLPHGVYEVQIVKRMRDHFGLRRMIEGATLRRCNSVQLFYDTELNEVEAIAQQHLNHVAFPNPLPSVPSEQLWNPDDPHSYFLWMGRFDIYHKGLDILLRNWVQLSSPRPRLMLVGPDFNTGKRTLQLLISELGLEDCVTIHSSVEGIEKEIIIHNCKGYIHPSRWEACSMVLNEMIASGVPCLVNQKIHAAKPLKEIGLVLTYTDSDSFAAGLGKIESGGVGGLAQRIAAGNLSVDKIGQKYQEWITSILDINQNS